ncbi:MAG: TIGR03086 family metal-binding protein [Acidimicrobiales bacterium]|nr:TIGR03086 family metal-binding protein [Acidimicrobiales bacterium]
MADVNALTAAGAEIRPRVAGIAPAQWDLPTPCTHWRVTDLVVHLIEGSRMALRLLQGASASEARRAFGVAHGSDLPSELDVALAEELAAFEGPDALTMTVHHPAAGDVPGATLIGFRTGDYLLHSWDLARATGGDERLPQGLVAAVWEDLQPMVPFIGDIGVFGSGPSGTVAPDAPLQQRLLDLTGRRP